MGGWLLNVLFGTATVGDLAGLHTTFDNMSQKQDNVVHALNDRVTYINQLDSNAKFNHQAVTNLAAILKDYVVKIRDK
jgi:CII-binding regulator of phage lambda lysogenization HflD